MGAIAEPEIFVGREWVFRKVNEWLKSKGPNALLITGTAGSGKSAIARRLIEISQNDQAPQYSHLKKNFLTFSHFCRAREDPTLSSMRFIEALSRALAGKYPAFAGALSETSDKSIQINVTQTINTINQGGQATGAVINAGDVGSRVAFDRLVRKPLETLLKTGLKDSITILVDALDEGINIDSKENIPKLLSHFIDAGLPRNVRLLLTSRNDQEILNLIKAKRLDLQTDDPNINGDLITYAVGRLVEVKQPDQDKLARLIAENSKGNFLYARYLIDYLLSDKTKLSEIAQSLSLEKISLPTGLAGVYSQFMEREITAESDLWKQSYRPLLGTLAVAHGKGLDRTQLIRATGLPRDRVGDGLESCSQFLTGFPDGPFAFYHESFREFLITDQRYQVYPYEANKILGEYFLSEFQDRWLVCEDDYALRYVARHLLDAAADQSTSRKERNALTKKLADLLTDVGFLEARTSRIGVDDLLLDLRNAEGLKEVEVDPRLRDVLTVFEAEAASLRSWIRERTPGPRNPSFFAQQIFNRASKLKINKLTADAEARLGVLKTPHILIRWQTGLAPLAKQPAKRTSWFFSLFNPREDSEQGIGAITVTPDTRFVISGSNDGSMALWNFETGEFSSLFAKNNQPIIMVKASRDGRYVYSVLKDLTFQVWDFAARKEIRSVVLQSKLKAGSLRVAADGTIGILLDEKGKLAKHDLLTGKKIATIATAALNTKVTTIEIMNDESRMVIGTAGGRLIVMETDTGRSLKNLDGPKGSILELFWFFFRSVFAIATTSDGNLAVSAHLFSLSSSTIRLWDLEKGELLASVNVDERVQCLAFANDNKTIVVGDRTGRITGLQYVQPQTM